jgi:hypothetical protein
MKRNAFDFAHEVDQEIERLSVKEDLLHKGRGKLLLEELLPISRLGIFFKLPGLKVEVEAFENAGAVDGHISIKGFRSDEFDVQVTYIHGYEESLRRELLVSQGTTPGAGLIFRDKRTKKITAIMKGTDREEQIDNLSGAIVERFRNKASKTYSTNTILLIAFDNVMFGGLNAWGDLLCAIQAKGGLGGHKFSRVFLFNSAHNELHRAA